MKTKNKDKWGHEALVLYQQISEEPEEEIEEISMVHMILLLALRLIHTCLLSCAGVIM